MSKVDFTQSYFYSSCSIILYGPKKRPEKPKRPFFLFCQQSDYLGSPVSTRFGRKATWSMYVAYAAVYCTYTSCLHSTSSNINVYKVVLHQKSKPFIINPFDKRRQYTDTLFQLEITALSIQVHDLTDDVLTVNVLTQCQ